jgi:hypothetical protein
VPLWWIPLFVCINQSGEEAIKEHDDMEPGIIYIYTDRSGIDDYIGAAAIVPELQVDSISTMRTEYMGLSTTSTVYAAELRGLVLAL